MKKFTIFLIMISIFSSSIVRTFGLENNSIGSVTKNGVDMSCNNIFSDVNFKEEDCSKVEYLFHQKVINGYRDGTFRLDELVTRGQIAKVIVNAFDFEIDTTGEYFEDVKPGDTFFEEIMTIKNRGIIDGYPGNKYEPNLKVNKGQISKFVVNTAQNINSELFNLDNWRGDYVPGGSLGENFKFQDVYEDSSLKDFIYKMEIYNFFEREYENPEPRIFRPNKDIDRREMVNIFNSLIRYGNFEKAQCEEYYCQDKFEGEKPKINKEELLDNFETYTNNEYGIRFKYPKEYLDISSSSYENQIVEYGGDNDYGSRDYYVRISLNNYDLPPMMSTKEGGEEWYGNEYIQIDGKDFRVYNDRFGDGDHGGGDLMRFKYIELREDVWFSLQSYMTIRYDEKVYIVDTTSALDQIYLEMVLESVELF